ncbi:DUF3105 domain-containing protein [Streptomyces sp. TRM68367]|uniref:DUF3105 domain-containing protein n=1 Tax=Streptomyces sp. TRM68367 TaxID=2758415 RepID=UPI00165A6C2C|nr:DUF3105 domain-containing protein [Streptomyces sp. TRM68367]MBC9725020.1 DUF3105 domain-containing protein [Streptomyces sp. TRM68367]
MGSKSKAKSADRKARIAEMRRAEQARERRNRIIAITASTVILAGVVGGGWYLLDAANEKEKAQAAPVKGEQTWSDLSQNHVKTQVDYPMSPAAGGDHHRVWLSCDAQVFTKEVNEENAVHSLEHGAVWITYNDKAAKADVKTLTEKVTRTPYSFISPYKDQSSPITLTAWGHQLKVDKASDPRVDQFLGKYVQGEQTPESGASCSGGSMQ